MLKLRLVIITFIFLATSPLARAQEDDNKFSDLVFPTTKQVYQHQLPGITKKEYSEIKKIIKSKPPQDEYCFGIEDPMSELFYKFDFSGDGIDDVIYSSYCGAEEFRNFFWTRRGTSLDYAGYIEGTPLKFFRKNSSGPFSLVVSTGWCCAGYVGSFNLYTYTLGKFPVNPEKKIMEFGGVTLPKTRMTPVSFITKSDTVKLRRSPEKDDKRGVYLSGLTDETVYGNILASYQKGSRGEAIAEFSDKAGAVWWFVIMDKDARTITNHFYDDENGYKTGWMNKTYLEPSK